MTHAWPPEEAVWFEVNGGRRMLTTCTPDDLKAHAAGFLLTEGYIESASDISSLEVVDGGDRTSTGVRAHVPESGVIRIGKLHQHLRENGCGLMHYSSCDRAALRSNRPLAVPSFDVFRELLRSLFAAGDAAYPDGGMHSAGLTDGAAMLFAVHDVGRHNTVDKAVGRALLGGHVLSLCGLVLTSRISGAIALKAARSGVSWIASRSVPTSLAVAIAEAAGMPIIARAASKEAVVIGARTE